MSSEIREPDNKSVHSSCRLSSTSQINQPCLLNQPTNPVFQTNLLLFISSLLKHPAPVGDGVPHGCVERIQDGFEPLFCFVIDDQVLVSAKVGRSWDVCRVEVLGCTTRGVVCAVESMITTRKLDEIGCREEKVVAEGGSIASEAGVVQ